MSTFNTVIEQIKGKLSRYSMPSIYHNRHVLILFVLTGSLPSCATKLIPSDSMASEKIWESRRASLQAIDVWELKGRVAINDGSQGWHINVIWNQSESSYKIRLYGPLGQGSASIEGDTQGVTMRGPDGKVVREKDAAALLKEQLGWYVPVDALRYWIVGLPSLAKIESRQLDVQGRLITLSQQEWHIQYKSYVLIEGMALPKKLVLNNPPWQVRFVIDTWRLPGEFDGNL